MGLYFYKSIFMLAFLYLGRIKIPLYDYATVSKFVIKINIDNQIRGCYRGCRFLKIIVLRYLFLQ